MVVEIRERRINLLGSQVGMLPQKLFRRPAVVTVFGGQVQDLVASRVNARRAIGANRDVRLFTCRTHGVAPRPTDQQIQVEPQNCLANWSCFRRGNADQSLNRDTARDGEAQS